MCIRDRLFVVLKDGSQLTEKEIRSHCKEQLVAYKVPKSVEIRKELPKTNVGKILRRELRQSSGKNITEATH